MGEPGASGTKEIWDDYHEEPARGVGTYADSEQLAIPLIQVQSRLHTPVLNPYQPWEVLWQSPKVRPLPYRGFMQSLPHQLAGIKFRANFRFSINNR
ncbi:hypothetical protein CR513_52735, partial [Mucuna pruriens]